VHFIFRVVLPLCGGNIDTTVLGRCLERGLAADGRLVRFTVTVSDRPGGIADLCKELARLEVSIKDIVHERAWLADDIFSVSVSFEHFDRILKYYLIRELNKTSTSQNVNLVWKLSDKLRYIVSDRKRKFKENPSGY